MIISDICDSVALTLGTDPETVRHIAVHLPGWTEADLYCDVYDDDRVICYLIGNVGRIIADREVEAALAPSSIAIDPTGIRPMRWRPPRR
jgi:hypothetical protein